MTETERLQQIYHTTAVTTALPLEAGGRDQPVGVHLLVSRAHILLAMWAVKTFYHYSEATYPLTFHCQGDFTNEEITFVKGHLPTARVITDAEAKEIVEAELSRLSLGKLLEFRSSDFLFQKLIDPTVLGETPNVLCIDSDYLFFQKPDELILSDTKPIEYSLFQKDCFDSYRITPE